jgi:XRE family transcriptional regulator, aerobic/anaerobic benzoate catabolism transcriptional regulator
MGSGRGAMDDLQAILDSRAPDYARADATLDTSAQDFAQTVDKLEGMVRIFMT